MKSIFSSAFIFIFLSVLLLNNFPIAAQTSDSAPVSDTTSTPILKKETEILTQATQDTLKESKNDLFYYKVKLKFERSKTLARLYHYLFRDPNRGPAPLTPEIKANYSKYNGKTIRNVTIKKIDIFGPSVNDTARFTSKRIGKLGNKIHSNTRKFVIRNDLLFKKGSTFDNDLLRDNERVLRNRPNILDARIIAIPTEHKDSVDIIVVTQDVWSISGDVELRGIDAGNVMLSESNFLGFGHQFSNTVSYSAKEDRGFGYRGRYRVPYIGNTFISGQADFIREWDQRYYGLKLNRMFVTPSMKYAGGIEAARQRLPTPLTPWDTTRTIAPYSFDLGDVWLGRAFQPNFGSYDFRDRTRIILAVRSTATFFKERPTVTVDSNQLFHNRKTNLVSIGLSERRYYRDVLIYGFGRTEDVPYGSMITFTNGIEYNEYGRRFYSGLEIASGRYHDYIGYFFWKAGVGSFFNNGLAEQGTLNLNGRYFSRLIYIGDFQLRQFVTLRYLRGIKRFSGEFIDINDQNGITGMSSNAFTGDKRVVLNLETILFTPFNLVGFKFAMFSFADFGLVGRQSKELSDSRLFQGYGLGLRVRNEHLAFNTFQIRLGFYPNIPGSNNPFRGSLDGIPSLRMNDFDIAAPQVNPF